jgi:hypothetical protein
MFLGSFASRHIRLRRNPHTAWFIGKNGSIDHPRPTAQSFFFPYIFLRHNLLLLILSHLLGSRSTKEGFGGLWKRSVNMRLACTPAVHGSDLLLQAASGLQFEVLANTFITEIGKATHFFSYIGFILLLLSYPRVYIIKTHLHPIGEKMLIFALPRDYS